LTGRQQTLPLSLFAFETFISGHGQSSLVWNVDVNIHLTWTVSRVFLSIGNKFYLERFYGIWRETEYVSHMKWLPRDSVCKIKRSLLWWWIAGKRDWMIEANRERVVSRVFIYILRSIYEIVPSFVIIFLAQCEWISCYYVKYNKKTTWTLIAHSLFFVSHSYYTGMSGLICVVCKHKKETKVSTKTE
jgi:hypothetical protein